MSKSLPINSTFSKILTISLSAYCPAGSKLKRRLPANSVVSWGMRVIEERSWVRGRVVMFWEERWMEPEVGSRRRVRRFVRVVLPAPVGPTMPTLVPEGTTKLTSYRTAFPE